MLAIEAKRFAGKPAPRDAEQAGGAGKPIFSHPIKEDSVMRHHLKLYTGEDHESTAVVEPEVTMTLGEITEILADAVRTRRAWLRDFEGDRVQVSADLYEVLASYWNMRRGA
jgi:hypothetical protein